MVSRQIWHTEHNVNISCYYFDFNDPSVWKGKMGFSSLRYKSISCLYNNVFSYLSFLRTVIMTITLIHYSLTIYYFEYPMLTYLYTTHCKIFVGRSAFVWNTKNHFALLRCVGIKLKHNYQQYMKAFDYGEDTIKIGYSLGGIFGSIFIVFPV